MSRLRTDGQRTDDGNVNIVLESAKQDSQLHFSGASRDMGNFSTL